MQVDLHSKAKHWGLMAYMDILGKVFRHKQRSFKYVDLFCGDGICTAMVGKKARKPQITCWDGPPLYAVKAWSQSSGINVSCIFNDKDPYKIEILKKHITNEGCSDLVEAYYSEEADSIVDLILKEHLVDPNLPSLIYLDPQKHSQLSWTTIRKIASFSVEDSYYREEFTRRPELIINLMTYSMYRSYKQRPADIARSLGVKSWIKKVNKYREIGRPIYYAFYEIFYKQLVRYYPEEGIFAFQVRHLENPSMNYFLFYAFSHPLAIQIFSKDLYERILIYQQEDLAGEYLQLKNLSTGQIQLTDFFNNNTK